MPSSYDLDAQVQRFLRRERQARERLPKTGQLALFGPGAYDGRPARRYECNGLVVDDDLLFSRAVSRHSVKKAYVARRYAEIVGTAMREEWELWWIELFAGPGQLYVRDTGEFIPGSPLEALAIPHPFHGYVFADLSQACAESLRRRVGSQAAVLRGDANSAAIHDTIAAIVPRTALVVLYADQEGLDLKWKTLEFFIDRYPHLDLLLNLPVSGIVRAVRAGYEEKAASLLDYPAPHELIETAGPKGDSIRLWYQRKLAATGFDQTFGVTVRTHSRNRELYDLVLASRHPLARKFFAAAAGHPIDEVDVVAG